MKILNNAISEDALILLEKMSDLPGKWFGRIELKKILGWASVYRVDPALKELLSNGWVLKQKRIRKTVYKLKYKKLVKKDSLEETMSNSKMQKIIRNLKKSQKKDRMVDFRTK